MAASCRTFVYAVKWNQSGQWSAWFCHQQVLWELPLLAVPSFSPLWWKVSWTPALWRPQGRNQNLILELEWTFHVVFVNSSFPSVVIVSPKETKNSKNCLAFYESLRRVALGNFNVWWHCLGATAQCWAFISWRTLSCMLRMKWSTGDWNFKFLFCFSPYLMSGCSTGWLDKRVFSHLSGFYAFVHFIHILFFYTGKPAF